MRVIGAVLVVAVLYWGWESPYSYYVRARRLLSQHPAQCEQLADQAVMKSGGNYPAAQLLQCRALAAMEEWDAALGGFSLIKDTTRCSPEALLDLGEQALEAQQFQLADLALQAARVPGPSFSRATELLVRLKLKLRLNDGVLELCREWQDAAPAAALPWAVAAEIEVSRFQLGEAISDYQEALRRSPSNDLEKSIRASLANLLVHTGSVAAARTQFDKLLEHGTVSGNVQLDYVQLLRLEGRFDEALAEIGRHVTENGASPEARKRRGLIQLDLGKLDEAIADLTAAVDGNEFDIGAHHLLAQAHIRKGESDKAQPYLKKSRRLTEATFRISELNDLLLTDPTNAEWSRELKALKKIVGR